MIISDPSCYNDAFAFNLDDSNEKHKDLKLTNFFEFFNAHNFTEIVHNNLYSA